MRRLISWVLVFAFMLACSPNAYATAVTASRNNDADDLANGAAFDNLGAWVLTVGDNEDFTTGTVTTAGNGGANAGTLTFAGSSILNTAASADVAGTAANALLAINAGVAGETVTLNGDAYATTFTITSTGTVNADSITGTTVNFGGDGLLSIDTAENITAAVTTSTTNTGTLTLEGTTTVSGQVGTASAVLKEINAGVAATTATFSNTVFTTLMDVTGTGNVAMNGSFGSSAFSSGTLDFEAAGGTVTFADNMSLFGTTTTQNPGQGNLTFSGTSTVSGQVGTDANYINTITVNGAGETLTLQNDVFATDITQSANNTLDIGDSTIDLNGTADGDYLLNDGGAATLALTITNNTTFGNIQATGATGTADIEAADSLSIRVSGAISNGQTFAIINSTDDSIAAVPGTITDNSAFFSFTVSEPTPGDLVLTAVLNSSGVATTPGAASTLAAVDNALTTGASSDMTTVANTLYALTTSDQATAALETMDPSVTGGASAASFMTAAESFSAVTTRLAEARSAGTGVATGDAWGGREMWVKGYGTFVDQKRRNGANGYDADVLGTLIGVDGMVSESWRLGVAGGYSSGDVDAKGEIAATDIDGYQGTVYGSYEAEPFYVNTAFSFIWNEYDASRGIRIGELSRTAQADYSGQTYSGIIDGGYLIPYGDWNIVPLASLQYSHLDIEGYTETGADALNLRVAEQDYDFLQSGLGVRFEYPLMDDSGHWTPELHVRWLYDFFGDEAVTTATFVGGGSSFTTRGLEPAQHSLNVGGGITFASRGSVDVIGTYDFELKEDYSSHSGAVTVRMRF